MGVWNGSNQSWILQWRRPLFECEKQYEELFTLLSQHHPKLGTKDRVQWKWEGNGRYSVKSCLNQIGKGIYSSTLSKQVLCFIWNNFTPPRLQLLLWFVALGKLKTGEHPLKVRIVDENESLCHFCNNIVETIRHPLFTCDRSRRIWSV